MRLFLWIGGSLVVLAVAGFGAFAALPQLQEKYLEITCSTTAPDTACQESMVRMGHTWSEKGELDRARLRYARAAEAGDRAAMFHLGWTYQQAGIADPNFGQPGRLVSRFGAPGESTQTAPPPGSGNMEKAAQWYRKAADRGYAPAMNNLGQLYLFGMLGQRDLQEAMRWHLAAARAGNPIAAMNVSLAYRTGMGVAVNMAESRQWASMSVDENSPDLAPVTLARTMMFGSRVDAKVGATLRSAAGRGEKVEFKMEPLKPAAGIPSFRQVQSKFGEPSEAPTLKQLQR